MRLSKWKAASLGVVACGLAACAQGPRFAPYRDAPPQVVEQSPWVAEVFRGSEDGVDYQMLSIVRLYPEGGKMGVCAVIRLQATKDVSAPVRESLDHDKSSLTISQRKGGEVAMLSPRFMKILYMSGTGKDMTALVQAARTEKPQGPCVVTDIPWQEQWAGANYSAHLTRWSVETRRRSQTVVGAPGAKP